MTNAEKALQLHKEWNGKLDVTPKCQVKSREGSGCCLHTRCC